MLRKLMLAGMNVTRFNFSHDTHEAHAEKFKRVVKLRRELGLPIATLLDTKGPEIRLRDFKNGSEMLEKGAKFTLTTRELLGDNTIVSVSYKELPSDVQKGGVILIDDGLIGLRVDEVDGTEIHCTVENGGKVSNHKGVNIPGADLSMPFISDQDRSDIEFGCQMGFDYIAASFTRTAADIRAIREILNAHGSKMKIIAKIESVQGVKNIKEIFRAADGVMVARGDLAPALERVAFAMEDNTVSAVTELDGKYYVFKCPVSYDTEATAERRKSLQDERLQNLVREAYERYLSAHPIAENAGLWDSIEGKVSKNYSGSNFFTAVREALRYESV